jgi:hypothetical protein
MLRPILKLFFNPNPLIEALHIQSKLNAQQAALEPLYYEVIHNLVLETTRLGIEVKNLKMRVESMSSRLDFDERRARALEGVVQYRPGAVPPLQPPTGVHDERPAADGDQMERRSRRRRRRGRRRPDDRGPRPAGGADHQRAQAGSGPTGAAEAGENRSSPLAADSSDQPGNAGEDVSEWRESSGADDRDQTPDRGSSES